MSGRTPVRSPSISTGVPGLDEVLEGGLPANHLYLVQGSPGVGKTTLALQFLIEGARRGEPGLYISLSESEEEIRLVAASHGWTLDGVTVAEFTPGEGLQASDGYTLFAPAEVELGEVMNALLAEVERVQPTRVVFDSLSEVRLLAQHSLRYRREILALKHHFAGSKRTVLLLDDLTAEPDDGQLQSLAHGVLVLEQRTTSYGAERRRLRVAKLRGAKFRGGYHDFTVETGGARVFPRLVAARSARELAEGPLPSGVAPLDALLGGGLDRGASLLVMGPSGAGKSSVAAQFVSAALARGERACVFVFDESEATLIARCEKLGMNLSPHLASGHLTVRQVDPAECAPGEFVQAVCASVDVEGARVVVIDSLNGLMHAMPDEQALLVQLHELLTWLRHRGVTSVMVAAQHGLLGAAMTTALDVSYLADVVLLLRYFEAAGRVRNAISVVKRRTGDHERTIREFAMGPEGLHVGRPLEAFHGVLTGVPTYTGGSDPLLSDEGHGDE